MREIETYSPQEASELIGVPLTWVKAWVRGGLIRPASDSTGRLRLSFRDVVALRQAKAPAQPRTRGRAVRWLAEHVGPDRMAGPFTLDVAGGAVVLRDDQGLWRADTGQGLLDLEAGPAVNPGPGGEPDSYINDEAPGAQVIPFPVRRTPAPETADAWLARAEAAEPLSRDEAIAAYREALALDPRSCEAHLELGRLLHETGQLPEAERHYRVALSLLPRDATAAFNLGVVLEDRAEPSEALWWYEAALAAEPSYADAHFNAARLCEQLGRPQAALRHLTAYRRLKRGR